MELRISFFFSFWFWEGHGKIMKVTRRDIDIHIDAKRGNQTRGGKRKNFVLSFFVSILISSLGVDDSIHIRFFYRSAFETDQKRPKSTGTRNVFCWMMLVKFLCLQQLFRLFSLFCLHRRAPSACATGRWGVGARPTCRTSDAAQFQLHCNRGGPYQWDQMCRCDRNRRR